MHQKTQYSTACVRVNLQVAVPVTFNYTTKQPDCEGACMLLFATDPLHSQAHKCQGEGRHSSVLKPSSCYFSCFFSKATKWKPFFFCKCAPVRWTVTVSHECSAVEINCCHTESGWPLSTSLRLFISLQPEVGCWRVFLKWISSAVIFHFFCWTPDNDLAFLITARHPKTLAS